MADNYALIRGDFTQGGLDYIYEIKAFHTLEEAQLFFKKNATKYVENGHMWSGLTRYAIMKIDDGKYVHLEGEPYFDHGTAFAPNEDIFNRKR